MTPSYRHQLAESTAISAAMQTQADTVEQIATIIAENVLTGHTLFTCGNGGSAADAGHFAEELSGRYRGNRRALPAQSLSIDALVITCIANDFGYDAVFARQLEALGRAGDLLVVLSTSGNSTSILAAIDTARAIGITTFAMLGKGGGTATGRADYQIIVPSNDSGRIQEAHMQIIHYICEVIEQRCQ
ncbi:MAG: SIS domain-containing protein [Chloroflexales bacterium]|nr:SIS domain-containing protein [Chloroflexales bacterium]